MKSILVLFVLLFTARSAQALDTTIRVLGVFPSDAFVGMGYMQSQLNILRQAWVNTNLPTSSGITIEVLNGDTPVPVNLPGRPSTHQALVEWANRHGEIMNIRNAWSADIIILFSELMPNPQTGACGAAQIGWQNNNFFADPRTGLDLQFADDFYVAVVGVGCLAHAAAHEFGHLLGGGHNESADNERLYHDSRAYSRTTCRFPHGVPVCVEHTDVLGTGAECPSPGADRCAFSIRHSRNVPLEGDGTHQNARTFNQTAVSVANYISAPAPPQPILNPPIDVHGFLIAACDQGWTRHQAHWRPDPQTNVQVNVYEIWYEQPEGNPLAFGWTVPVFQTFSDVFVIGANSRIRVKACTVNRCSDFSFTSYLAQWVCAM